MPLTHTAYGTWSGGRFMHFGEALTETAYIEAIQKAYSLGIRSFITADVYGSGSADTLLGEALKGIPRESYHLACGIGHDFYQGTRQGSAGFPRFTHPSLRSESAYLEYLKMAVEKSLERCQIDSFDVLFLHNPDEIGYTSPAVWDALSQIKEKKYTASLGIAPGPANGFVLDLIDCFEKFGDQIDWAMLILNPLEPWPMRHVLPAAEKYNIKTLTRVLDYGGLFHDDVLPEHPFKESDHRNYRPEGWIEKGRAKIEKIRPIAKKHDLTLLQLAAHWNLAQPSVASLAPTFIQEAHSEAKPYTEKLAEFAAVPSKTCLSPEEVQQIAEIGDNTNSMLLKGASKRIETTERADQWPMRPDLLALAKRWNSGEEW